MSTFAIARLLITDKFFFWFQLEYSQKWKIMLTRKRAYSGAVIKKLHCGEIFEAVKLFPPGELLTKRHVIERLLDLPDFRTLSAARKVA